MYLHYIHSITYFPYLYILVILPLSLFLYCKRRHYIISLLSYQHNNRCYGNSMSPIRLRNWSIINCTFPPQHQPVRYFHADWISTLRFEIFRTFCLLNKFSGLGLRWMKPCAVPKSATATNKTFLDETPCSSPYQKRVARCGCSQTRRGCVSSVRIIIRPYPLRC